MNTTTPTLWRSLVVAHSVNCNADLVKIRILNLLHASADASEAAQELAHWFKPDELHSYDPVHAPFTQPQ